MSFHVVLRERGRTFEGSLDLHGTAARLTIGGHVLEAAVHRDGSRVEITRGGTVVRLRVAPAPHGVWVACAGRTYQFETPRAEEGAGPAEFSESEVRAPMAARVVSVAAAPGAAVREGDLLLTLEAMKMEFRLASPLHGAVEAVHCAPGDRVELGQLLARLAPAGSTAP